MSVIATMSLMVALCGDKIKAEGTSVSAQQMPKTVVDLVTPIVKDVIVYDEFLVV